MRTLKSKTGKKAVNITKNNGNFICCYVQINEDDQITEDLIELKEFKTESRAIKWAEEQLN